MADGLARWNGSKSLKMFGSGFEQFEFDVDDVAGFASLWCSSCSASFKSASISKSLTSLRFNLPKSQSTLKSMGSDSFKSGRLIDCNHGSSFKHSVKFCCSLCPSLSLPSSRFSASGIKLKRK